MQSRQRGLSRVSSVSEEIDEWDQDEIVLQVNGPEKKPFLMEGLMCGNTFQVIIDTGSPVFIFAIDELKRIIGKHLVAVREMIDVERYVDFNRRPLPLQGVYVRQFSSGKDKNVKGKRACRGE